MRECTFRRSVCSSQQSIYESGRRLCIRLFGGLLENPVLTLVLIVEGLQRHEKLPDSSLALISCNTAITRSARLLASTQIMNSLYVLGMTLMSLSTKKV